MSSIDSSENKLNLLPTLSGAVWWMNSFIATQCFHFCYHSWFPLTWRGNMLLTENRYFYAPTSSFYPICLCKTNSSLLYYYSSYSYYYSSYYYTSSLLNQNSQALFISALHVGSWKAWTVWLELWFKGQDEEAAQVSVLSYLISSSLLISGLDTRHKSPACKWAKLM